MADIPSKRKRDIVPENEDDKLEIDVNLPEPPSKKAKRKEKKQAKTPQSAPTATSDPAAVTENGEHTHPDRSGLIKPKAISEANARSPHSIWIGNLRFNATKDDLRTFLQNHGSIDASSLTRLHMPINDKKQNKGFAYIDFDSEAVLNIALSLSEKLLNGRAVLIKNAKSFEGRPEKKVEENGGAMQGKTLKAGQSEPSKRVFVGNLSFDVTREELEEHFAQAGEVEDVFMATFEDSGKCKGFAWVRFTTVEAASNAVKGFILQKEEEQDESEDEGDADEDSDSDGAAESDAEAEKSAKKKGKSKTKSSKKSKLSQKRHYINRIQGRQLRCEFAQDAQTRYKKRFGKSASSDEGGRFHVTDGGADAEAAVSEDTKSLERNKKPRQDRNLSKDERQEMRRKRHDARMIAPGKALSNAPRAKTGVIVEGEGRKTTFD